MTPLFFSVFVAFGVVVAAVAVRDHRRLRASRAGLLDDAASALEAASIVHGGDDFPRLRGRFGGYDVHADLIPDTMVVRRLPQLWLSVTLLAPNEGLPGFGVLVRYAGNEFYALTTEFAHRLERPSGFPHEVLIRAQRPQAQSLLDTVQVPLAKLLADPCIKEIAVTAKGLRIVRQAAEGRRGEHLLLRQAIFDLASVPGEDLIGLLLELSNLHRAILLQTSARAA